MRGFRVVNLGVMTREMAPDSYLNRKSSFSMSKVLADVISTQPECFEGEDLTVAYALEERLRTWGTPAKEGTYQTQELITLNSDERRVVGVAENCKALGPVKMGPEEIVSAQAALPEDQEAILPKDRSVPVLPLVAAGLGLIVAIAALGSN